MISNRNRNISVSKGHSYTVEKVRFAMTFVQKAGRNTTLADWVNAYNYIKDANETADGCQACKGAKFTAAVRNYAQYGYLTLINEGHDPNEFVHHPSPFGSEKESPSSAEVFTEKEVFGETEQTEQTEQQATENDCVEQKQPKTVSKKKVGRPKAKKTTKKKV